jgi:hypothetical protein
MAMVNKTIQICRKCGKNTINGIRIKEGEHLCYACYCSRCNADGKEKHHRDEAKIQAEFFCKVKLFFPKIPDSLLFAVPNGGSRNKIEAANLKRQGVKPGVADVLLLIPASGYGCLSIEFKTPRGRQSPSQREFQRQVEKAGNKYVICRSVIEGLRAVSEYLNLNLKI